MNARLWAVLFVIAFAVYVKFGLDSLAECAKHDGLISCAFDKRGI